MNLILWRHAEAEEGEDDAARALTDKGERQARRMAAWLHRRLPEDRRVLCSPAERARQTAAALTRTFDLSAELAPGARAADVLKAAGWPDGGGTVVLVGHQPALGAAVALALTGKAAAWRVKKGGVWWLRAAGDEPLVLAVMNPDLL